MMLLMYLTYYLLYYEADVVDVVLTKIWEGQMSIIGLIIITISCRGQFKEPTEKRKKKLNVLIIFIDLFTFYFFSMLALSCS